MKNRRLLSRCLAISFIVLLDTGCKVPDYIKPRKESTIVPDVYSNQSMADTAHIELQGWKLFFTDPYLSMLIDTALKNNQELNSILQEIEISKNEIRARKAEYLPFLSLGAGAAVDKAARYTNIGAMEANTNIIPGKEMPEPLPDYMFGLNASWELDIWKKLRNAKKAAVKRYLATVEGRNFTVTNLVAEVANLYYELISLDNQLSIVKQNIDIQSNALRIVRIQKEGAKVTELAVRKFEAEVLKTQSLQYDIQQKIIETENRINFLLGRYPQPVLRSYQSFETLLPNIVSSGMPAQLLQNRPDIKKAEQELAATKLDVKSAKARFYPSINISASTGYRAFDPYYLIKPQSLLYNMAGDLMAPLINRNAIKAAYYTANAKQIQAVFHYEQILLNAYIEVVNQLSRINNLEKSFDFKSKQVQALTQSIAISNDLFKSARADYMEVLMTQRDALDSKFDLIETKMQLINASINLYRSLGGGWKL